MAFLIAEVRVVHLVPCRTIDLMQVKPCYVTPRKDIFRVLKAFDPRLRGLGPLVALS